MTDRRLLRKYSDLPATLADVCLVRTSEITPERPEVEIASHGRSFEPEPGPGAGSQHVCGEKGVDHHTRLDSIFFSGNSWSSVI